MRLIAGVSLTILALLVAGGLVLWRAPLWVLRNFTAFQLSTAGIKSHTITVDGHEIHYIEGGAGQPVVLLHGLASNAEQDWGAIATRLVVAGYHVYAPDLLGFGQSAQPKDATYSIPEQAHMVESFIDAQPLDRFILGGFSMGGWVADRIALDRPSHVTRLMLFDAAGLAFTPSFPAVLFTPGTNQQVDQFMALVGAPSLPGFIKADFIRNTERNGWVVKRAWDSMMSGHDFLDQQFGTLKMPMLIVWGREDKVIPVSVAESMHRLAPQSRLHVYDGCGHIAPSACSEKIAPTVLAFLK